MGRTCRLNLYFIHQKELQACGYLLTKVDLPLAAKSIRTGMNQTILLSLLTVVIASLIGAAGLGEDVLEALQYASVGQGILAGLAILFIAMIIDGIVQGKHKNG